MIKLEAKRILRMATATVPLWKLVLFAAPSALILLTAAFGAVRPARSGVKTLLAPQIMVMTGLLWQYVGSGCINMAVDTWKLRIPRASNPVRNTLLLLSLLTIALPTAVATLHGEPTLWTMALLLCMACSIFAMLLSPRYFVFPLAALWLFAMLSTSFDLRFYAALAHTNPAAPFWLLLLSGIALSIGAYQLLCLTTGRHSLLGSGVASYESMRANAVGALLQNGIAQNFRMPWLSPRTFKTTPQDTTARIRILLGRAFAPGDWQRQLLSLLGGLIGIGLFLWLISRASSNNDPQNNVFSIIENFISPVIFIILVMTFPQYLNLAYRRHSHDLHELALLPNLTKPDKQLNTLMKAILWPVCFYNLALLIAVCFCEALILHRPVSVLLGFGICASLSLLVQVARMLRTLAKGSTISEWTSMDGFVWMMISFVAMGAMYTVINALNPVKPTSSLTAAMLLTSFSVPLLILSWRWYQEAAALPHPFLDRG